MKGEKAADLFSGGTGLFCQNDPFPAEIDRNGGNFFMGVPFRFLPNLTRPAGMGRNWLLCVLQSLDVTYISFFFEKYEDSPMGS